MRVKIIKTGKVQDVEPGYAVRLMEQGKAVAAAEEKRSAAAPAEEKKGKAGKTAGDA